MERSICRSIFLISSASSLSLSGCPVTFRRTAAAIVLFLDEMHTIIGAGGAEGAIDASNILKPSLARGEIQLIGATTIAEYRKYVERDTDPVWK